MFAPFTLKSVSNDYHPEVDVTRVRIKIISSMPVVKIPPRDQRTAKRLAATRNRSFEEIEGYDNSSDSWGKDPEERNYIGLLGEFAFAIYYDLQIDAEERRWGDEGYDFEVQLDQEKMTVDIKTTVHDPDWLSVKERPLRADYYVLVQLQSDAEAVLIGGATAEMVEKAEVKKSPRYGHRNYVVPRKRLLDLPETVEPVD